MMNSYRLKDPTPLGKEFLVDKFNQEFSLNMSYWFFREKLDQLKIKIKKYKRLTECTDISVDPITQVIYVSDSWWKDHEVSIHNIFIFTKFMYTNFFY